MSAVDVASNPIHIERGFIRGLTESFVVYLTVASSVIPMCILESDSTASVKLRIQTCKGFLVKKQKLVFEGKELSRNNSLVKDYGVSSGDILHLILRVSDLLKITVETAFKKDVEFRVDPFRNGRYLKQKLAEEAKGDSFINVEDQEILCNGKKLDDICKKLPNGFSLQPVIVNPNLKLSPVIWSMLSSASAGLKRCKNPIRSSEGTGGAYFMQHPSGNKYVAVFKPVDEEPMAVNNPHGLPPSTNGEGLKRGTKVGEGALREVAAYILDHPLTGPRSSYHETETGFSGVPPTIMAKCLNPGFNHPRGYDGGPENIKIGSLQMFVKNCGSCEDMGPWDFPVEEVHKITVLDIRTANADRHAGNILMNREGGRIVLTPIDHGYCLPENSALYTAHLHHASEKGAANGLSPLAIGRIMCRETVNKESMIEKMVQKAHDSMLMGMSEAEFLETVSKIMDFELETICV
ncbi:hypothetical protein L1987_02883 [Smallanthus sonchifolius]|uniref:Uncharacterized protein n=1 Tax=Smallanthus sonchifolius TaxID=185202 RepID=A0ACB9K971_9ASTR|nr:hypothetical protein L1987_02883 [Smallanthus sonchifolius]